MPTAIEIFKHLPKKNCGECKFPTCLAFAMQLANGKAKLDDCPHVSDQGRQALAASSAPPIATIAFGGKGRQLEMGGETEIYRHEKKFYHPVGYALMVSDSMDDAEIDARLSASTDWRFERVGQTLGLDAIEVRCGRGDAVAQDRLIGKVMSSDLPIILRAPDDVMADLARKLSPVRPLLHGADKENLDRMMAIAKECACPLVLTSTDLDELADMAEACRKAGIEDIVLDFSARSARECLSKATILRKDTIRKTFRGLGYPIYMSLPGGDEGMIMALTATMKYASLITLEDPSPEHILPLFVLRQNIYTDPQVPIQVRPELYAINNPGEDSPILFTTNFSLTYFTVMADIEKSKVPVWLQVIDTEGLSVLTAFSAGKLTAEGVAAALDATGARERSRRNVLVIPGMVARMSAKLNEVTGMRIVVGPKESSGLPKLLKNMDQ